MMPVRNDYSFADGVGVAFAMYCDVHSLSTEDVERLSDWVQRLVESAAATCVEQRELP